MEIFSCKTKIISGSGAISALSELKAKRLLLVADPYFQKTDLPNRLKTAANAEVLETFFEVKPDPTVALAAKGTGVVQSFKPDTVVALGGGSAMDCAKAAPLAANSTVGSGVTPKKHSSVSALVAVFSRLGRSVF